ncbi:hypothetical protein [Exiguobacterium flavidum]|uniref:hypothetical protein n=1 Tax=Exiguobacterium flavidum TaxID=2184695 RepID=UPI000DF835B8|nr:hypothetical protein [Exiguobacterium flavidum]
MERSTDPFQQEHDPGTKRLQERIRHLVEAHYSLGQIAVHLTGQQPTGAWRTRLISRRDWAAWTEDGLPDPEIEQFYSFVSRYPIVAETGQRSRQERKKTKAKTKRKHVPLPEAKQRRFHPKYLLLPLFFLLGVFGTYLFDRYDGVEKLQTIATSTPEQSETEKPAVTEESEEAPAAEPETTPVIYITATNAQIFSDAEQTTALYEADFGDRYTLVKEEGDVLELTLPNGQAGFIAKSATTDTLEAKATTDSAILDFVSERLDTSWTDVPVESWFGKSKAELAESLGAPGKELKDSLHTYLFYGNHFFILKDDKVIAIDWTNVSLPEESYRSLELQLDLPQGKYTSSDKYAMQVIGSNRVRIAEIE